MPFTIKNHPVRPAPHAEIGIVLFRQTMGGRAFFVYEA